MKIGVHGSYYGRNFGDTLILAIIVNWVREYNPQAQIFLPFVTSEQEAIEILGHKNPEFELADLDGLIFGPGGYFGEPSGGFIKKIRWSLRNYERHIKWNKIFYKNKLPYIIVGVGVGPLSFRFIRRGVVKLFGNANAIAVRDKYSRQYLIDWGIQQERINQTSDVALSLVPNPDIKTVKNKVALHFPAPLIEGEHQVKSFIDFIKAISEKCDVHFFEDINGQFSRSKNPRNLKNLLDPQGLKLPVVEYKDPNSLIKDLQSFDKIITSKLHVGIVGYSLGKRVLSIPAHPKTMRFYEQIDRSEFCIPFQNVTIDLLVEQFEKLDAVSNFENIQFEKSNLNKKIVMSFLESLPKIANEPSSIK
jgi:polysaccharide pyruvyl transferase WcaK-like protein